MENTLNTQLRKGWTTGTCATAAAKAAFTALLTGEFPDHVDVLLPRGERPSFNLAQMKLGTDYATNYAISSVIKDAGDDPDVTHGAVIRARVCRSEAGKGIIFRAGMGVGTVTKAGLILPVGEPAINPVPRQMIKTVIDEVAKAYKTTSDVEIEISVENGEQLALKTMNPRLGIVGGISILGTTGIVIPFSCSAWIHSIYNGIDVARAEGLTHIAGATGSTSESAVKKLYNLPDYALIDMGDFVGGMLKYSKKYYYNDPIIKITIAGGFGKMCKLAQGLLDLHSRAGSVDFEFLANISGVKEIAQANTAKHALEIANSQNVDLAQIIAKKAWQTATRVLDGGKNSPELEIVIFDREGILLARN